jgi:hypothetical protein
MKTYVCKSYAEATSLGGGEQTVIEIPVKEQVGRVTWNTVVVGGTGGWTDEHGRKVNCPYAPGDVIAVKEAIYNAFGAVWAYQADNVDVTGDHWQDDIWMDLYAKWLDEHEDEDEDEDFDDVCPAEDMPELFVRTHLGVLSIDVREMGGEWKWIITVQGVAK